SWRPELLEVLAGARREPGRVDRDDDVLLARPRVARPVRRTGPDRGGVAHDVLVMHEIGHARDRLGREREPFHRLRIRDRRRRYRDVLGVVEVVREPDRDPAFLCGTELATDD